MTTLSTAFAQGTAANRPAASASNTGFYYLETDTAGGTLYQSTGSAWVQLAPGVSAASGGTYPKFMVNLNGTNQSIPTGTFTKVAFATAEFDTNSNFDTTTNYRFTPTVAGYYQIVGVGRLEMSSYSGEHCISIYKNGAEYKRGDDHSSPTGNYNSCIVSATIYCNGTTDYLELFVYQATGNSINLTGITSMTYFSGSMLP